MTKINNVTLAELYTHGGRGGRKIDTHRGPATSYANMTLPDPPKGHEWTQNTTTKEWILQTTNEGCEQMPSASETTVVTMDGIFKHKVQDGDTFQGICLKYKVTPTQLRQANRFSGNNLLLAPEFLTIPGVTGDKLQQDAGVLTREQQIALVRRSVPGIVGLEAKAYLELNDWNVDHAIQNAKEDFAETEDSLDLEVES
jgi:LysM repeat protein